MTGTFDLDKIKEKAKLGNRYQKQLNRLAAEGIQTACIEQAVDGVIESLPKAKKASIVVYGEPQSGKTEMMICLTARLLDEGKRVIVHLLNDSVDLLSQNLKRFKISTLAPAPRTLSEIANTDFDFSKQESVLFCKKNALDLEKLIAKLKGVESVVVIDDEADYATPNAKVNKGQQTPINKAIADLIGENGFYIGVTATPARLNLNNTLQNDAEYWVQFPPHDKYTGQEVFFPLEKPNAYNLTLLPVGHDPQQAIDALLRFLVRSAHLNTDVNKGEKNYSFLVHTSGKKDDHEQDRVTIESAISVLSDTEHAEFDKLIQRVFQLAGELYPAHDSGKITEYVVENISRVSVIVLNSQRDRKAAGDNPTEPTSPFTIIIGGNIVSRGVTFPNLLAMYFTRNVAHRLQQDTYIQRARMFGARGAYLKHFELTIPQALYANWQKCFVFHRLALETIKGNLGSPVWLSDSSVAVASPQSIDKATVIFDKGEMSFQLFDFNAVADALPKTAQFGVAALQALRKTVGNGALPEFLLKFIERVTNGNDQLVVLHTPGNISKQKLSDKEKDNVQRRQGFIGNSQLNSHPGAAHHVRIY